MSSDGFSDKFLIAGLLLQLLAVLAWHMIDHIRLMRKVARYEPVARAARSLATAYHYDHSKKSVNALPKSCLEALFALGRSVEDCDGVFFVDWGGGRRVTRTVVPAIARTYSGYPDLDGVSGEQTLMGWQPQPKVFKIGGGGSPE